VSRMGTYDNDLTDDQIAYLHERAAERRAIWAMEAELVRQLIERAICGRDHTERVPHNGFGWIGTRCSKCGFIFFGEWEGWVRPSNEQSTRVTSETT
jgi:hypothetical protein